MTQINKNNKTQKGTFTILGISIWRLLAYFIIYSIVGYMIETVFGLVTKGVLESRKSFLYGPFCSIYGLGAVIMIPCLKKFDKNNFTLFFGGFILGSVIEYIISLIGEVVFHIKWWDYSDMAFNINGRICIAFSFFWGILAIFLMTYFNPKIDRLLDKIPKKYFKVIVSSGILLLFLDFIITGFALRMFFTRLAHTYDLDIPNVSKYSQEYTELYEKPEIKRITDTFFTDEKMLKTFPNIKFNDTQGNVVWICDVLRDIQPYYVRVFTPKVPNFQKNE